MKKFLSLFTIMLLATTSILPAFAQSNGDDTDRQLAELLEGLEGSNNEEETMETQTAPEEFEEEETQEPEETQPEEESGEEHQAAEDILDMIENGDWDFAGDKKIEVTSIDDTSITLSATAVIFDGEPLEEYRISYSTTTIADITNFDDIQFREVMAEEMSDDEEMVTLTLDELDPETRYYIIVSPIHPTDPDIDGFSLSSPEVAATTNPEPVEITSETRLFQNVSYTQNDNSMTVTWDDTSLVENGVIEIRHQDETEYTKLGTFSMDNEEFTFTVSNPGNHFLKVYGIDENGDPVGQEQVQNIKVEEFDQPDDPVQNAPQVGPATDIIMLLFIFAMIIYFVYRFRRIER